MSPFSSTLHNNFKERLSVFHMINDQQGVESERGCKIFSAGFPPPPTFAAVSMFHMIKSHMIKTWNTGTAAGNCTLVNWQNWHLRYKWIRVRLHVGVYTLARHLPHAAAYSQCLTQRASSYTKLHLTGAVTSLIPKRSCSSTSTLFTVTRVLFSAAMHTIFFFLFFFRLGHKQIKKDSSSWCTLREGTIVCTCLLILTWLLHILENNMALFGFFWPIGDFNIEIH